MALAETPRTGAVCGGQLGRRWASIHTTKVLSSDAARNMFASTVDQRTEMREVGRRAVDEEAGPALHASSASFHLDQLWHLCIRPPKVELGTTTLTLVLVLRAPHDLSSHARYQ